MPRNSSGVYSLPSSYEAVAGDDILPEQHNAPLEDIAAEITASVAADGRTAMTGRLVLAEAAPTSPRHAVPLSYLGSIATADITVSSSSPYGGSDGDIWFRV